MAITVTGDAIARRGGSYFAEETATQSTATAFQALATTTDLAVLGGGTATGHARNRYSLAEGTEGEWKFVLMNATGEAHLYFASGTATGMWVFSASNQLMHARFLKGLWRILESGGATTSTST